MEAREEASTVCIGLGLFLHVCDGRKFIIRPWLARPFFCYRVPPIGVVPKAQVESEQSKQGCAQADDSARP